MTLELLGTIFIFSLNIVKMVIYTHIWNRNSISQLFSKLGTNSLIKKFLKYLNKYVVDFNIFTKIKLCIEILNQKILWCIMDKLR